MRSLILSLCVVVLLAVAIATPRPAEAELVGASHVNLNSILEKVFSGVDAKPSTNTWVNILSSVHGTALGSMAKVAKLFPNGATSGDSDALPKGDGYFRWIPEYTTSLKDETKMKWSAPCFQESSAYLKYTDSKTPVIHFDMQKPASLLCSDMYLIATMESIYIKWFFFHGEHQLEWTFSKNVTAADMDDVKVNGFRIFRFLDGPITTLKDLIRTVQLFLPALSQAHVPDYAAGYNLQFMADYANMNMPRRWYQVSLDESEIESGDFLGITRLDGLDPMLAWAMGAATGHTAIAMRMDGQLYVCESTVSGGYWPTNGIQKTPYKKWLKQAEAASFNVVHIPLSKESRSKFNVTAAINEFKQLEGLPYGFHNMLFAWIDTMEDNFPYPLSSHALQIVAGIGDKLLPSIATSMWNEALNMRLGTKGLRTAELAALAHQRNTSLVAVMVMPEQDSWVYSDGRSLVCDVFVCAMYKAGGLFGDVAKDVQCSEFTDWDVYAMNFFGSTYSNRPQKCIDADPDIEYCQIMGDYRMYLHGYNTKAPYAHMAEKCPSKAPHYIKPADC